MTAFRNPVLMLTLGLPAAAVVASVATLIVALSDGDSPLPEQYHWEGMKLDRDFSRGQRARDLAVIARLEGLATGGTCAIVLRLNAPAPERLTLSVAHATLAALDRQLVFDHRSGARYETACSAIDNGHWRFELADVANGWTLRRSIRGDAQSVSFDAGAVKDE